MIYFEYDENKDIQNFYSLEDEPCYNFLNTNEYLEMKDENGLFEENNNSEYELFEKPSDVDFQNILTMKTEATSTNLLNQKRYRDNDDDYDKVYKNNNFIFEFDNNDDNNVDNNDQNKDDIINIEKEEKIIEEKTETKKKIKKENNGIKKGRRRNDESYIETADHNKFNKDNIMRKIKSFFFKYILIILNGTLKNKYYKFYPLNSSLNEDLKKDFNEKLLKRTIRDIFENSELCKRNINRENANKLLIQKIFKENTEKTVINILNSTYNDILDYVRDIQLENFLGMIRKKELKNKKNTLEVVESYMKEVKELLLNYEKWFGEKLVRNYEKKNNK